MSVEEEAVISQERDCVSVAIVVKIGGSETDAEEMGSPGLGVQLRVEFWLQELSAFLLHPLLSFHIFSGCYQHQ